MKTMFQAYGGALSSVRMRGEPAESAEVVLLAFSRPISPPLLLCEPNLGHVKGEALLCIGPSFGHVCFRSQDSLPLLSLSQDLRHSTNDTLFSIICTLPLWVCVALVPYLWSSASFAHGITWDFLSAVNARTADWWANQGSSIRWQSVKD